MKKSLRRGLGILATTAALLATAMTSANAAPGGGQGPPTGKGPGGGETSLGNNLSVPTIIVSGGLTNVTCLADSPGALVTPWGSPYTGYPIDPAAYYYVQGLNTWQAQCYTATSAKASAAWGDNLNGDAALKTRSPIRVELALFNSDTGAQDMDGYTVVKLDPSALDRESAYGILATGSVVDGFSADPTTFTATEQLVYDSAVTFSIYYEDGGSYVVPEGTRATAEINATGKVVYGYNLRVNNVGAYTITFNIPNVTITGKDLGTFTDHTVTLTIDVSGNSGKGKVK